MCRLVFRPVKKVACSRPGVYIVSLGGIIQQRLVFLRLVYQLSSYLYQWKEVRWVYGRGQI